MPCRPGPYHGHDPALIEPNGEPLVAAGVSPWPAASFAATPTDRKRKEVRIVATDATNSEMGLF
jgi:hypothetical protein